MTLPTGNTSTSAPVSRSTWPIASATSAVEPSRVAYATRTLGYMVDSRVVRCARMPATGAESSGSSGARSVPAARSVDEHRLHHPQARSLEFVEQRPRGDRAHPQHDDSLVGSIARLGHQADDRHAEPGRDPDH